MRYLELQQVDQALRRALPVALAFSAVIFGVVPLRVVDTSLAAPNFTLMVVYFWTLNRPELMPPWAVFLVGLLADILTAVPMGMNAAILVVVHAVMEPQHRVLRGKAFELVWAAFAVVAIVAKLVSAGIGALFIGAPFTAGLFGVQVALTIVIYPIAAWLMALLQRAMLPQS